MEIIFILSIPFLIGTIVHYYNHKDEHYYGASESIAVGFLTTLVVFTIFVGAFTFSTIYAEVTGNVITELGQTTKIESFNNTTSMSGSFFLFGGSVGEDLIYRYVVKDNLGFQIKEVNNKKIKRIVYNNNPRIEEYKIVTDTPIFSGVEVDNYYIIYVPKNTIKANFNVDLR